MFSRGGRIGDPGKETKGSTGTSLETTNPEGTKETRGGSFQTNPMSIDGTIDPSTKIEIMIGTVKAIDKDSPKERRNSKKENSKRSRDSSEERKVPSPKLTKLTRDKINSESSPK